MDSVRSIKVSYVVICKLRTGLCILNKIYIYIQDVVFKSACLQICSRCCGFSPLKTMFQDKPKEKSIYLVKRKKETKTSVGCDEVKDKNRSGRRINCFFFVRLEEAQRRCGWTRRSFIWMSNWSIQSQNNTLIYHLIFLCFTDHHSKISMRHISPSSAWFLGSYSPTKVISEQAFSNCRNTNQRFLCFL